MTILSIETSTRVCSAALSRDGQVVTRLIEREEGNHAKCLPLFIDQLMANVRSEGWQVDAVALSEGPGSYTGLRIGASTAKGLCYGMDIPLIPIPTTDVLCAAAVERVENQEAVLVPMIDARRMEVYTARYRYAEGRMERISDIEARIIADKEWLEASQQTYYFGDGAAKCHELLESENVHLLDDIVPDAVMMGSLAERSERRIAGAELAYYEPFYLKDFVAAPSHIKGLQ